MRELLLALHVTQQRLLNGTAWRHSLLGGRKLQPHSQENLQRGLWPRAVCREAFYYPKAMKPGCRLSHKRTREWLLYAEVPLSSSAENSHILSQIYKRLSDIKQTTDWTLPTLTQNAMLNQYV